jgi:aryl-alcohol dehydrogenase-like predicted oxidoreductase
MNVPDLGFGTGAIMGRVSSRLGLAALERAYAAGIRHFDTARSYGWGEAEGVLGRFLRGHAREEIRLVTKCGIMPVRRSPILGAAKALGRVALSLAPGLRAKLRQVAGRESFRPTYTADAGMLASSLQTSLDELGVSYVDTLLLHNFMPVMAGFDEVVAWFVDLKRAGVIRRYGFSVEGDLAEGLSFLAQKGLLDEALVQTPVSSSLLNLSKEWREVSIIAHSPFEFLRTHPEVMSFTDLLRRLGSVGRCETVVCSMFDPAHLASNVAALRAARA